jgi:heme exporter protein C
MLAAFVRALFFTPMDAFQGLAQKIFYLHVPAAIIALYVAVFVLAVSSAMYLWLKDDRLDRIAEASAEVGLVFLTVVLLTGPLWGKPVWGTWWEWDARLTSTLFLWFLMLSYMVLRSAIEEQQARSRLAAVVGVLMAPLTPFIHLTVYMFRTLHPDPVVLKPSAPSMSPEMLTTFLITLGATFLLYLALLRARYRWTVARDALLAQEFQ